MAPLEKHTVQIPISRQHAPILRKALSTVDADHEGAMTTLIAHRTHLRWLGTEPARNALQRAEQSRLRAELGKKKMAPWRDIHDELSKRAATAIGGHDAIMKEAKDAILALTEGKDVNVIELSPQLATEVHFRLEMLGRLNALKDADELTLRAGRDMIALREIIAKALGD